MPLIPIYLQIVPPVIPVLGCLSVSDQLTNSLTISSLLLNNVSVEAVLVSEVSIEVLPIKIGDT